MTEVGIIGAGPSGLATARYLAFEGFEPVLFEQGATIGGQWSGERAHSGVWPSMRTNTSRILTAFSDLPHANGSHVYPPNQSIREYLHAYAERFSLTSRVRLRTPVVGLERGRGGRRWLVRTPSGERAFAHVVVATGAFQHWTLPAVPGLPHSPVRPAWRTRPSIGMPAAFAGCGSWSPAARSARSRLPAI